MDRTRELILLAIGAAYSTPANVNKAVDADLAIEIADRLIQCGLVAPPPAAPKGSTERPSKVSAELGDEPKKNNKRYICTDCQNAFKSTESLLDVTCPKCNSTHIEKRKNALA